MSLSEHLMQELLDYMGKRVQELDIELSATKTLLKQVHTCYREMYDRAMDAERVVRAQRENIKEKEAFINSQLQDIIELTDALAKERQKKAPPNGRAYWLQEC
jgi:5-bromo-4-chloroindolyl phosphate hydrolysis protein